MQALCWHGRGDIRCDNVPDPKLEDPRDILIKVTSCAICGSDLHLMDGQIPTMKSGDILGHETMGEVIEVGSAHTKFQKGDRVVVPFTISCGECRMCKMKNFSCCERTNPNAKMAAAQFGYTTAGLFGFSHLTGGFAGGQAQYLRVPYADVGPIKVPDSLTDEQVLFLSDIFPTAYQAAEHCEIQPTDTIVVFGCGPVGLLIVKCCHLLGAKRVIAIDRVKERMDLAKQAGADVLNLDDGDIHEQILQATQGLGPDAVIDAVGAEAHGGGMVDTLKAKLTGLERPTALQEAIRSCRPCGIVSVPGVYGGPITLNMGALMQKGLTIKSGQTHVQRYLEPLLKMVADGKIDPGFIITHRIGLKEGPEMYETFRDKKDGCIKVVIHPN
jgi:threonine dehydrogenase-like Zn-dependent dehydrogenase